MTLFLPFSPYFTVVFITLSEDKEPPNPLAFTTAGLTLLVGKMCMRVCV